MGWCNASSNERIMSTRSTDSYVHPVLVLGQLTSIVTVAPACETYAVQTPAVGLLSVKVTLWMFVGDEAPGT